MPWYGDGPDEFTTTNWLIKLRDDILARGSLYPGGSGGDLVIDNHTLKFIGNVLTVNTTNDASSDNTRPITSAGVYTIVGNIEVLLEQI